MELMLVGASIIATVVLADLFFKVRKRGKMKYTSPPPVEEKRKQPVDLLKELRSKAYL
jgi:hypothetical protein